MQLSRRRLSAAVLGAALAACRGAHPADTSSSQPRGASAAPAAVLPVPQAPHRREGGVASTDAALLVEEADRWR